MSDYSRFVSYMYLYENGLKTMNAGFVKVESRNGQCRIGLSLKNVYTGLERCQVYMFIRFGQELRGVYIGDVQIKNHGSDWNFRTDTMNIAGSGYRLAQMSGMIILGEGEKFYGTRWDHGDLDIHRFVTRWDDNQPIMEETPSKPITSEQDEQDAAPIAEKEKKPEGAAAVPEEPEGAATVSEEPEAAAESFEPAAPAEPEMEKEAERSVDLKSETKIEMPSEPRAEKETEMPSEAGETVIEDETVIEAETVAGNEEEEEKESGRLVTMETNERRRNFGKIIEQCPGMYPFEDDSVDVCVRLEPQDIGRMPIDCWSYGSNSFLLHGYYSYRHLILARVKPEKENRGVYILGVPGTQHSREAFMANMFGFREFKPIREGSEGPSDFGYWYTFLA